ncbi:MAG TPA: YidC/Oxa1 family membrane protein insertase, partial [Tepidisphaeraceae bacterium]|nr:YidC/Oxa1 family membrane protein insertase [Tepidisphaeraceae bacterium]
VVLRDWGLAIIALVFVVRALLHPITKKSQVNMVKMQKMAPEIERLKKKYGDDKEGLNQAMMQFYKEQGPSQVLGCLPMFLQMPIWIALYSSLQSTFEMRQSPFLRFGDVHLTWIKDLAHPDRLFAFQPIALPFGFHVDALNVLPILMGVVFYLQMKLQPKPATMTPEQEQQQKMMMWMMPFIFPLVMYNGPAGLNLYILTSTTLGIIENKIIRKHIREQDEREKGMGPVIVDAPVRRRGGGGGESGGSPAHRPDAPSGGLGGWLARMQQKAEELQREAARRKRKGS